MPLPNQPVTQAAAILAIAAPTLLAYNVAPSSTFLNQALSFGLWGWFLLACANSQHGGRSLPAGLWPVLGALGLLALAAVGSFVLGSLPSSLFWSAIATLLAAALVLIAGGWSAGSAARGATFQAVCLGWLVAGLAGVAIGIVQVFAPGLSDGNWIAHTSIVGRAVGNLRQPNHLSSVLLWAVVAAVALVELRRLGLRVAFVATGLLVFAVVLSASRTGLLSVILLALWALIDRRLSRGARALLLAAPLFYLLAWLGMSAWSQMGEHRFGGQARLAETDISGSRFGIWGNTLALIRAQPWLGVGFGEFNFAWSLTPFPGRPTAFFDHTHNLPLQFAVELGLPLALLVIGLLCLGLWRVLRGGLDAEGEPGLALRCSFVMLLMIGLHSLLEYPLWYAYFLLPTAWIWGYALARPSAMPGLSRPAPAWLSVAGAVLVAGAVFSVLDYSRVTVIFSAGEGAPPLEQRIANGRRSVFFAHHADYAAATTQVRVSADELEPLRSATHFLLDTRLMTAWAEALQRQGRHDEALQLVQRLREFRNPASDEFFEACKSASSPPPFQCASAGPPVPWRAYAR